MFLLLLNYYIIFLILVYILLNDLYYCINTNRLNDNLVIGLIHES